MMYIIDGNNFAGAWGVLEQNNSSLQVVEVLSEYFQNRRQKVILVFDSSDYLGDKYIKNGLLVIHSPRDDYYTCADDKILELAEHYCQQKLIVVSDDIEIRKKVEELRDKGCINLDNQRATELVSDIKYFQAKKEKQKIDNNRGLSDDKVDEINKELLEKFRRKREEKN